MPDRLDLDLGVCEECRHPVSEHLGAWCHHRTGVMNDAGRELICCCTEADAGAAERAALIATADLREKLAEALVGTGISWYVYREHVADALMPTVREALAEAWDRGALDAMRTATWDDDGTTLGYDSNRNLWRDAES